ncbi:rhodanese-like domain-containing protein [Tenacibaculum sp. ZS6-P6]|uniref:rhodanese-like domain-containing protein n=1 Tax=Tenacibaculum sp. ZS6-P6 TaxID=3447503 RepID=UPI003F99AC12
MRKFILGLIGICILFSCANSNENVKTITVDDLKLKIREDKNIQILDVRTSSETSDGVIFNAIQVNLIFNSFETRSIDVLNKDKPVYVYCRSGRRSKIAAGILADNGYDVYNVKGGYVAWEKALKNN